MLFNFTNKYFALFSNWPIKYTDKFVGHLWWMFFCSSGWRQWRWHCVVSFNVFSYFHKVCYSFCLYFDGFISIHLSDQILCSWFIVLNQVLVSKCGPTRMNHHLYKLRTCVSFRMVIIQRMEVEMRKSELHSRLEAVRNATYLAQAIFASSLFLLMPLSILGCCYYLK